MWIVPNDACSEWEAIGNSGILAKIMNYQIEPSLNVVWYLLG